MMGCAGVWGWGRSEHGWPLGEAVALPQLSHFTPHRPRPLAASRGLPLRVSRAMSPGALTCCAQRPEQRAYKPIRLVKTQDWKRKPLQETVHIREWGWS